MPTADKRDVLLIGPLRPWLAKGLADFTMHKFPVAGRDAFFAANAGLRAVAVSAPVEPVNDALFDRLPKLQIVSSFGVGYDHIDAAAAAKRGIIVTHTPDVLNEEVADTALGLLLCTVREFPQAERHVRAGRWPQGNYPLSKATLRNRTIGLVGMGRIGVAIARRLEGFGVPIVYHARRRRPEVAYRHYPKLIDMARDVDTLIVIVPGGARNAEHDRRARARRARPRRYRHQCRTRLGRRRAGVDRGAQAAEDFRRRARRIRG